MMWCECRRIVGQLRRLGLLELANACSSVFLPDFKGAWNGRQEVNHKRTDAGDRAGSAEWEGLTSLDSDPQLSNSHGRASNS